MSRVKDLGKQWLGLGAIALAIAAAPAAVRADDAKAGPPSSSPSSGPGPTSPRPGTGAGPAFPYSPVRYVEDYSYLKDSGTATDPLDPIKYIPLNPAGDVYLSLGGQFRERYEYFHNNTFGSGVQDPSGFYLTRLMAHADLHIGDSLRGFFQLKSAMEDNRDGGPRAGDADEFDVQQAFADFNIPLQSGHNDNLTLRAGRQELIYGVQRVIGPVDWTNVRRTFEGIKGIWTSGQNQMDVFWVRPVIVEKEEPNSGDGNTSFAGVYDSLSLPEVFGSQSGTKLEGYFLVLNKTVAPAVDTAPAVSADSDTYTMGLRFASKPAPFDFDTEAAYQFGKSNGGDINAYSLALEAGYAPADVPLSPRLFIGFDYASGDDDLSDPDVQTYNQLFPTGHLYLGYIDVIGRQNIIDIHPGVEFSILKNHPYARSLTFKAEYHQFWRASTDDAVYNASGGITRAAVAGNNESSVGGEIDLLLNWQMDRHLSGYIGYSHFFAGDFIQQTGPGEDIDFFYAALVYTF